MAGLYIRLPTSESGSLETHRTFGAEPLAPSSRDEGRATSPAHPQEPPRPDIRQLLNNKDHNWSGIVRDYDDCQELMRQYMSLYDKTGETYVAESNDFPEDKEAQKELARQLFEAILELYPADTEHMHYKSIRELSNIEVELLSWELLFAIRRAQDGIVGWAKWSSKSSQKYQRCRNFRERFDLVKKGCRESKLVVYGMLSAPFMGRLTAAPSHECRLKTANKKINARKGVQLKGYRDIMAEKNPKSDDDSSVPSKRKRMAREDGGQQAISKAPDYKRLKIEVPGRLTKMRAILPAVSRGALGNIPSHPAALDKAGHRKRPSASRNPRTPKLAGESVAGLDQLFAPSPHQMPISGAVDVKYPVAQPNPAVWLPPPADFPLPPPAWGPPGTPISPYPEETTAALAMGTEPFTVESNYEGIPAAFPLPPPVWGPIGTHVPSYPEEILATLGTGTEASTVVSNLVDFNFFGGWADFGADA